MSWSTVFIIAVVAVLSPNISADDPCRFESSTKGVIDLTSLALNNGSAAYPDTGPVTSNYLYSYNPCKPFSEGDACLDVAVCQVSKDGRLQFPLAKQESAIWNPDTSPSITYSYGVKKVLLSLQCVTDDTNLFEALGESPINVYRFRLTNKCACWNGCKGPQKQNCSINGSLYTSDKQIIQSLPFPVAINPSYPRSSPPRFSYATVDIHGQVTDLTLVNVSSIPPAIFCLKQVQALSLLDSTNLPIPPEISLLSPSLQSLTISNISPSLTLPPELFNMTLLSTLSIVNSGLTTLSEYIIKLQKLTELTLDQNQLVTLPRALGRLLSLTLVSADGNRGLSSLDALNASASLTTLRASSCAINHLPTNIQQLRSIVMDDNQLTSLDGIENLASSTSDLWSFRENMITLIPSASLEKLIGLNNFYLSKNQLSTLPDALYQIKGLQTLDVRNNNFDTKESEWIQGLFRLTNTTVLI